MVERTHQDWQPHALVRIHADYKAWCAARGLTPLSERGGWASSIKAAGVRVTRLGNTRGGKVKTGNRYWIELK